MACYLCHSHEEDFEIYYGNPNWGREKPLDFYVCKSCADEHDAPELTPYKDRSVFFLLRDEPVAYWSPIDIPDEERAVLANLVR